MDKQNLGEWIGRSETVSDVATAFPYAALSATFDRPAERPPVGTALPALWHWLYFLPLYRQSEVGPDGHAKRGAFLPPVPLPRRMWAGSQFEFHQPLRIGDAMTRTSTIHNVTEKSGRTGPLVFVKVRHEVRREGESDLALTEFHDIVYREAPKPGDVAPPPKAAPATPAWGCTGRWWPPCSWTCCATSCRRPKSPATNSAPCARCSTSIISTSAASPRRMARPSGCGPRTTRAG